MTLKAFTSNYKDESSEAGFQFTFQCDICKDGYKTRFIESRTYKRGNTLKGLGNIASVGASLLGRSGAGWQVSHGIDRFGRQFGGMSPAWHKEHEEAFQEAQNEAKGHFTRCPKDNKWVCEMDWNEQSGLCTGCAPRENVEVASARAGKMVSDIQQKASQTQVFTGEIEEKQTICHQCGKPAGQGKFCNNCGASLEMISCETCGTKSPLGTRFCGECGGRME